MLFETKPKKINERLTKDAIQINQRYNSSESFSKSAQFYSIIIKVLDLLHGANPTLQNQIESLKKSISLWYDHINNEFIRLNKDKMKFTLDAELKIKDDIGFILEEIAYFLRNMFEHYQDKNLQIQYCKYLGLLKKLKYGGSVWKKATQSIQIQVDTIQQSLAFLQQKTYRPFSTFSSFDTPKKHKQINYEYYLKTRQQNLQLQKKIHNYQIKIQKYQQKCKKLSQQLKRLYQEIQISKQNQLNYLVDIKNLKQTIDKIRSQQKLKIQKQNETFLNLAFSNYQDTALLSAKRSIRESLNQVHQNMIQKQQNEKQQYEYEKEQTSTNRNLGFDQQYETVKKIKSRLLINDEDQSLLRLVFSQAIFIQEDLNKRAQQQIEIFQNTE